MRDIPKNTALAPPRKVVAADSPRAVFAVVLGLTLLFIGIRAIHLEADTPIWVGDYYARELLAEPPAKAHEARNYALFGTWHLNPNDNYQFWRVQSPFWVYPLALVFKTFGTGYPQLRLYATFYSAIGLYVVLWLAARHLSWPALLFAGIVVAIDRVYFHYARVGLLEPAVNTWIAVAMFSLMLAERRVEWLIVAQLSFVLALFTKQAALYALPIIALASSWLLTRPPRAGQDPRKQRLWRRLIVLHALLISGLSATYMNSASYRRTVMHNFNHMLVGDGEPNRRWRNTSSLFARVADGEKYHHFWLTVPLTGLLATGTLCFWLVVLVRSRKLGYFEAIAGGWFVCAFVAMWAISTSELRYWTLLFFPAALVAAAGLDGLRGAVTTYGPKFVADLRTKLWIEKASWLVFVIPFAITLVRDGRGLYNPLFNPTFTLRDGAVKLMEHLGETDATIIGMASPPLVLGTPYKNFYVRDNFNAERARMQKLGITHIVLQLVGADGTRDIIRREFPRLLGQLRPSLVLNVRNLKLRIIPVGEKMVNYRDEPVRRPLGYRRPAG